MGLVKMTFLLFLGISFFLGTYWFFEEENKKQKIVDERLKPVFDKLNQERKENFEKYRDLKPAKVDRIQDYL